MGQNPPVSTVLSTRVCEDIGVAETGTNQAAAPVPLPQAPRVSPGLWGRC